LEGYEKTRNISLQNITQLQELLKSTENANIQLETKLLPLTEIHKIITTLQKFNFPKEDILNILYFYQGTYSQDLRNLIPHFIFIKTKT